MGSARLGWPTGCSAPIEYRGGFGAAPSANHASPRRQVKRRRPWGSRVDPPSAPVECMLDSWETGLCGPVNSRRTSYDWLAEDGIVTSNLVSGRDAYLGMYELNMSFKPVVARIAAYADMIGFCNCRNNICRRAELSKRASTRRIA